MAARRAPNDLPALPGRCLAELFVALFQKLAGRYSILRGRTIRENALHNGLTELNEQNIEALRPAADLP
jgi:hypothetical protein